MSLENGLLSPIGDFVNKNEALTGSVSLMKQSRNDKISASPTCVRLFDLADNQFCQLSAQIEL